MAETDKIMTMGEHIQNFKEVYLGYDTLYVSAVERFIKMMVGAPGIADERCIVVTNDSNINTKNNFRNIISREINGGSPLSCTIIGEGSISGTSNNYIWDTTNLSIDQCVPVKDMTYKPKKNNTDTFFDVQLDYITIDIPDSIGYLPLEEMNWHSVTAATVTIKENATTGYVLESFGSNVTGDSSTGFEVDLLSNSSHSFFVWDVPTTNSYKGVNVGDLTFNKNYIFELYGYSAPTGNFNALARTSDPIFTGYTYTMGKYNYFTPEYTVTKFAGVNGLNPRMLVFFKRETTLTVNQRAAIGYASAYVYPTQPIWIGKVRWGANDQNLAFRYVKVSVPPDVDMSFTAYRVMEDVVGGTHTIAMSGVVLAGETQSDQMTETGYSSSQITSIVCNGPVDTTKKSYFTYERGTW